MKKITILILCSFLISGEAQAFFVAPYIDFNITINTNTSDSVIDFIVKAFYPSTFLKNFSVQTTAGSGSYFFETNTFNGEVFNIQPQLNNDWKLTEASCTSMNPNITTYLIDGGINITTFPYSQVNCVFDIEKVSGKKPTLIISGTLGTEIWKSNEILWPDIPRMINPIHSDSFMDPLEFTAEGKPLDTSLTLGEVLTAPHPSFNYLQKLLDDLKTAGYQSNKDLFLYAYDWREEMSNNSSFSLKEKIDNILASTTASNLNIIAHSQGGLLIKRLLFEHPEYKSKIGSIIFVGTPNLGSPKSAKILVYGDDLDIKKYGLSLDPLEILRISKNMPAIYEMLPSREYFNHSNGYIGEAHFFSTDFYSSFEETKEVLKKEKYELNPTLLDKSDIFHSSDFDNFNFTNTGIKVFNIIGCEAPTIGKIVINGSDNKNDITYAPGDGTVPLVSASNIYGAQNYYVLKKAPFHGTMLTDDNIKEKIVNILSDKAISSVANITTNPALCEFNGNKVEVHSPVDLHVYDENGRHVGPNSQGGFDYEIPEVQYDTIEHSKYAFLPENGHTYTLKLVGSDNGVFNFYSTKVENSENVSTEYFSNVPVSVNSIAEVNINSNNNQVLNFVDGRVVEPSSILDQEQSKDLIPPVSTSTLDGLMGRPGFHRSNVKISISATDPVIMGHEAETSGVLSINYSLDGQATSTYASSSPITVTSEGSHNLSFFATDKAGNAETVQNINFTIDKTAPEFNIQFDPSLKDLKFTGQDNTSTGSKISVLDQDTQVTLTDEAGNTSQITLKDKNRKKSMKAEIKSLSYNNQPADINKLTLHFEWQLDKNNNLKNLSQELKSKKDFNIKAEYENNKTKLEGKDLTGKIKQTLSGLILLKVSTKQGDFEWGW